MFLKLLTTKCLYLAFCDDGHTAKVTKDACVVKKMDTGVRACKHTGAFYRSSLRSRPRDRAISGTEKGEDMLD